MAQENKNVCIDLDGVLATYEEWKGVDHIGEPIDGAREFVFLISAYFKVTIYTTRCNPEVHAGHSKESLKIRVENWLRENNFYFDEVFVGEGKPIGVAYIDDRAIYCNPQGDHQAFHRTVKVIQDLHRKEAEAKPQEA